MNYFFVIISMILFFLFPLLSLESTSVCIQSLLNIGTTHGSYFYQIDSFGNYYPSFIVLKFLYKLDNSGIISSVSLYVVICFFVIYKIYRCNSVIKEILFLAFFVSTCMLRGDILSFMDIVLFLLVHDRIKNYSGILNNLVVFLLLLLWSTCDIYFCLVFILYIVYKVDNYADLFQFLIIIILFLLTIDWNYFIYIGSSFGGIFNGFEYTKIGFSLALFAQKWQLNIILFIAFIAIYYDLVPVVENTQAITKDKIFNLIMLVIYMLNPYFSWMIMAPLITQQLSEENNLLSKDLVIYRSIIEVVLILCITTTCIWPAESIETIDLKSFVEILNTINDEVIIQSNSIIGTSLLIDAPYLNIANNWYLKTRIKKDVNDPVYDVSSIKIYILDRNELNRIAIKRSFLVYKFDDYLCFSNMGTLNNYIKDIDNCLRINKKGILDAHLGYIEYKPKFSR